jgi:CRP-like cAMP-binding protein
VSLRRLRMPRGILIAGQKSAEGVLGYVVGKASEALHAERRLARLFLLLANYGKEGGPPIVPVILSQETLADMIGTTRSRVSFFMNKFRTLGLIDYKGQIDVHQSLLNAVLNDKPEIRADEPA